MLFVFSSIHASLRQPRSMGMHEEQAIFERPGQASRSHESFASTPYRPRTRPGQDAVRQLQNQQEALLLANQKRRGERQPTADRLTMTGTFPHAQPGAAQTTDR